MVSTVSVPRGRGVAVAPGSVLCGLGDRLAALDGTISVTSPIGGGTRIRASIPADRSIPGSVAAGRPTEATP